MLGNFPIERCGKIKFKHRKNGKTAIIIIIVIIIIIIIIINSMRTTFQKAKLQFMVFQKYCSEKSEIHYWYIRHNMIEISEKILKFQQCVPSQSPTNHPICCHLVYQCLCTKKKIQMFQWKFVKTLLINSFKLYSAEPFLLIYTSIFKYICSEMCRNSFHFSDWRILRNILTGNFTTVKLEYWCKEQ